MRRDQTKGNHRLMWGTDVRLIALIDCFVSLFPYKEWLWVYKVVKDELISMT